MREEVVSSGGPTTATPTVSSAGASSPAFPTNACNVDGSCYGLVSRVASVSYVGSEQPWISLSTNARGSAFGSSQPSCRPWEREDLLRRLSTYKPSSWSGKPKVACSLACAQRGWINDDVDKIACESCSARLSFDLLPSWISAEVFANQLDTGHKMTCPWRGNSCPQSLVQFPPTPQPALVGGYRDRCDGLLQFHFLPVVAVSTIERMRASRGAQLERFLSQPPNFPSREVDLRTESAQDVEHLRDTSVCIYFQAQKLISLCGWEPRWLPNVLDCEEHSALSARNGCSFGPTLTQAHILQDPGPSKNRFSASAKKGMKQKALVGESRDESRSPLLDCSLCGATVKILDFLTVPQPARIASTNIDIPDTSKKIALTRGASAASGINGWADDTEKEEIEDRDEVATTSERRSLPNVDVDLNLFVAGGSSSIQLGTTATSGNFCDAYIARDPMIGQAAGSEVGDRAASYESRGPNSRKRSLEIGGSSDERTQLMTQQVDSVEGVVIDRDNDEVTDERQYSAGPSKRICDSDMLDTYSSYLKDSSGAGPSYSKGLLEIYADANRVASYRQESDQNIGGDSTRDSVRASSVIAMDTLCNGGDDISQDSVENNPGDVDDIHLPSSSMYGNQDMNEASELNYSNQVQQSMFFQQVAGVAPGEMGVSSTNDGGQTSNAETVDPRRREGFISFGVSGGSVGMCASHEAEIHGTGVSAIRADSVGDVGPKLEDVENQGQMGESAPGPGLMDEIIPEELIREDPQADSQDMFQSIGRADSGSKVDGSPKAESFASDEKISQTHKLARGNMDHPVTCNAIVHSGYTTSKEVTRSGKTPVKDSVYLDCVAANGPPKGESNYEEANKFDPIEHHNMFCPWVNGNVAAAGSNSSEMGANAAGIALCGWQLTLDALDAMQTLGNFASQTLPSESAASLHKDDHQNPGQKLLGTPFC